MSTIEFAPWEPDRAPLGGKHASEAQGVIPAQSGYIPFPSLQEEAGLTALPGPFTGAISFYDTEGNPFTVAGAGTSLYVRYAGQWQEIGSGYSDSASRWSFARYGNTIVAVNGADAPQYATIGTGSLSEFQPIEGAPVGSSVEVVKEFVIIGGVNKTKVQWSAIGNPLDWPIPGSNDAQYKQSDEQDFPDTGSAVAVSGALTGIDVIIFTERAIYRGQYIGAPYVFQFTIIDKGRGTLAPRSVVTGKNAIYFLSEEGFFATNGSTVQNIGLERINRWFRSESDDTRRNEVRGAVDPVRGIIVWTFASNAAEQGRHDRLLVYHAQLDRWSHAKADTVGIFSDLSTGKTLEELDQFGAIETLPFPLDSNVWKGGVPGLAAFSPENKLCWFAGMPMAAVIETAETGGERFMIHGVRPLIDGAQAGASVLVRDFQHMQPTIIPLSAPSPLDGFAYGHISTRYARARVSIPAGLQWAAAMGCDLIIESEGGV